MNCCDHWHSRTTLPPLAIHVPGLQGPTGPEGKEGKEGKEGPMGPPGPQPELVGVVKVDEMQFLDEAQQAMARYNIGAAPNVMPDFKTIYEQAKL